MLSDGAAAPDFILPGSNGTEVREYMLANATREGPVVLLFYPFDFYRPAADLLDGLRDRLDGWPADISGMGVSRDSAFSHRAFARETGIGFPLLSDSDGHVSETYGVLAERIEAHGPVPRPAAFVVDARTKIRYAWAGDDPEDEPDWDAIAAALGDA